MNSEKIKRLLDRIDVNSAALKWLHEHAPSMRIEVDHNDFKFIFKPILAAGCDGASEASDVIASMARIEARRLFEMAAQNCRNTIEIDRAAIAREVEIAAE
jgi:hypothetical protein